MGAPRALVPMPIFSRPSLALLPCAAAALVCAAWRPDVADGLLLCWVSPAATALLEKRRAASPAVPERISGAGEVLSELRRSARRVQRIVSAAVGRARGRRARGALIDRYLATHDVRKLHLGGGENALEGWLNADLRPRRASDVFIDVRERFPFEDGTFDCIASEHMIGDLPYADCRTLLAECHRVMKPGGRIRLSTPDLQRLAGLYQRPRTALQEHYLEWSVDRYVLWADAYLEGLVINNMFQEFPFVYDGPTLTHLLTSAGFSDVEIAEVGVSRTPALSGVEAHGRVIGDDRVNRFESVVVEATRPATAAGSPHAGSSTP